MRNWHKYLTVSIVTCQYRLKTCKRAAKAARLGKKGSGILAQICDREALDSRLKACSEPFFELPRGSSKFLAMDDDTYVANARVSHIYQIIR